jgi:predicted dithiol-disulfide oxidoreductase (DUF899 family)
MKETIRKHKTGTRDQWLAARLDLLKAEKELARRRQELPWVRIEKKYRFETDEGSASLADLFRGRSQLLVYHFMFGPDYNAGCPACSSIADGFNGIAPYLANHDVMLWAVSRLPFAKLRAYKRRMGWSFPWASSSGGDFNFDFNASWTEEQQKSGNIDYNYSKSGVSSRSNEIDESEATTEAEQGPRAEIAASVGTDWLTYIRETPGMSAFALEGGVVYHTYSAYARGLDVMWGLYQWLDRAPLGRNEEGFWIHRRDEYDQRGSQELHNRRKAA